MIICQFIFAPGVYDAQFHELDSQIDAFARNLPGFRDVEVWQSPDGATKNATYYFDDMTSLRELSALPEHLAAKGQYRRWYDGYQIVISELRATYGDDRMPHVTNQQSAP